MASVRRQFIEALKISCLSRGIAITGGARSILSNDGRDLLTVREYPTTGGITFELPKRVFINAPFDEWYTSRPEVTFDWDGSNFTVEYLGKKVPVSSVFPLPGYLTRTDDSGRLTTEVAMSHADRVRLSPIGGCAYDCAFCDVPMSPYAVRPLDQVLDAFKVALADSRLPPRHALISGGSPRRSHYDQFETVCISAIRMSPIPVDIMMSPMIDHGGFLERVVSAGVHGFSINLEVYSSDESQRHLRRKHRSTRRVFEMFVTEAVNLVGTGRVRSLLIAGLEPLEETLAGVEYLAALGVDPVLSPFRPANDVPLRYANTPTVQQLGVLLKEARAIVERHGVQLGPRCEACQHNTLTYPWDSEAA